MKTTRLILALIALLLFLPVAHGQQVQQQQRVQGAPPPAAKPEPKIDKEDRQLAMQMLEAAESAARGFEPPMRAWGLLQLGQTFASSEPAKARTLLVDSFTASLSIAGDDHTKESLQNDIFAGLLPLSQSDVEERLAQAESPVRKRTSEVIVKRYIEKKQFGPAMDLITQVAGWDEFPYGSGTALLLAMPADMQAEKMSILAQAVSSYKAHEHPGIQLGGMGVGSFTDMIVRFGPKMPPKLALQAIDEILSQAKKSEEHSSAALSGDGGTAAFNSIYDYQLFALLPLLRQLDESRTTDLIKENAAVKSSLEKFPNGLQSLDPTMNDTPLKEGQKSSLLSRWMRGDSPNPSAGSAMYLEQENERKARQIAADSTGNPIQAIAEAQGLPLQMMNGMSSPRADALDGIAHENAKTNPTAARQALDELRKTIADLPLKTQVRFLSGSASLYLQMGDKESAAKVVSEGFKVAARILDTDMNPDNPNKALKAWWPSADAYRRFIDVQARLSHRSAANILKEIKDAEMQTVESIMLSRSLLGLSMRLVRVEQKTKDSEMIMMQDAN